MSDTSGLPNTNAEGVPAEDQAERFEGGGQGGADRDAQAAEPAETEPGQKGDVSEPGETGIAPEGAEDVTTANAGGDTDQAVPPPADFDPAQNPSNPDLVSGTNASEPPD
ncbi:hypothetical protein [Leifsonia xyli]|uniref:hypothetical protein n=1 Tax=Leifsonia xyli TaxID=1575 RepID=UPI003D674131